MPRRVSLALLLNALVFAALVLLSPERERLWAMRALADVAWPARVIIIVLPFIALLPPVAALLAHILERAANWLARAPRAAGSALLAGSGVLFWLLRERTLWGDALYTLALLEGRWRTTWRGEYFWKEPLDRLIVVAVYQISHVAMGWDAWRAIALVSCLAGVTYVWIAWRFTGDMTEDSTRRGLAFALLLSPGAIQLLFGHVENYTLVTVAALGYLWLAVRVLRGRGHPALVAGALGLAIAFHPQAVFLVPSLAVLAWVGPGGWRGRWQRGVWLALGLAIPLLALLVVARVAGAPPLRIGLNRFADDTRLWLSLREILAPIHLADVLNNLYLVAPAVVGVILLLAAGWGPGERWINHTAWALRPGTGISWPDRQPVLWPLCLSGTEQAGTGDRHTVLLAVATLSLVVYSLIFAHKLPRPDDWDLYAIVAVPITVWAAYLIASASPVAAQRVGVALLVSSLCLTGPWVWSNYAHQRVELNPAKADLLVIYRTHDLIAAFPQAQAQYPPQPLCEVKPGEDPTACQYVAITRFTMPQTGDTRPVLVTHPPAQVSYRLRLPDQPSFLWLSLALDPMTWGWGGDGATFILTLDDGAGTVVVLQQHVGNGLQDQGWHDVAVDLTPWRGREVTLTFSTGPGPANDYTGDRAGWGLMQIMVGEPRLAGQG